MGVKTKWTPSKDYQWPRRKITSVTVALRTARISDSTLGIRTLTGQMRCGSTKCWHGTIEEADEVVARLSQRVLDARGRDGRGIKPLHHLWKTGRADKHIPATVLRHKYARYTGEG